ncbi:MAG: cytochrome P450 [Leptospiraceae bacterium]|nr:cytochrome P450 [Leptospiraceae bacterium]
MSVAKTRRPAPFHKGNSAILGSLLDMEKNPAAFMATMVKNYNEVVAFRMAHINVILCIHPDAISHVLHENHMNYDKQVFDYKMMGDRLLGKGLLTNDGPFWLKQRRLAQPAFHRKRVEQYSAIMKQCTEDFIRRWQSMDGEIVDVSKEMAYLTLRIVGLSLFGKDLTNESTEIGDALSSANHLLTRRIFSGLPNFIKFMPQDFRLRKASRRLARIVDEIIAERKGKEERYDDLLSMLMQARDDADRPMDSKQLRDEVLTLLLAGHETTANALSWCFHLLSENPEQQDALSSECRNVLGSNVADFSRIPDLGYAQRVMEEAMRIYPPAWSIARRCKEDDEIMGYGVKGNTLVFLSQLVTHRHPDFWDAPMEFRPSRFQEDEKKNRHPYAYFPFGGGPRLCIGADFAMMESVVILSALVGAFRLQGVKKAVEPELLITLRPRGGLPMKITTRS